MPFETAWNIIFNEINGVFSYMITHPAGTTRLILICICAFLFAICIGFYWQEGAVKTVQPLVGERSAATSLAAEIDTGTAILMTVCGFISLIISIGIVIWYVYTANVDIIGFFLQGTGRH